MNNRILINKLLNRITSCLKINLIPDIDEKIYNIINKSNLNPKNSFFDFLNQKKINLDRTDCKNIEDLLYKELIKLMKLTPYKLHLNKLDKEKLDKYELTGLLKEFNRLINIKVSLHSLYYNQLLLNEKQKPGYLIEYSTGRQFLSNFYLHLTNKKKITSTLKFDPIIIDAILTELFRKTPRIFNINQYFPQTEKLLNESPQLQNILIFCSLYYSIFSNFNNQKEIEDLWIKTIKQNQNYKQFDNFSNSLIKQIIRSKLLNVIKYMLK
jgi:hypothetical protein